LPHFSLSNVKHALLIRLYHARGAMCILSSALGDRGGSTHAAESLGLLAGREDRRGSGRDCLHHALADLAIPRSLGSGGRGGGLGLLGRMLLRRFNNNSLNGALGALRLGLLFRALLGAGGLGLAQDQLTAALLLALLVKVREGVDLSLAPLNHFLLSDDRFGDGDDIHGHSIDQNLLFLARALLLGALLLGVLAAGFLLVDTLGDNGNGLSHTLLGGGLLLVGIRHRCERRWLLVLFFEQKNAE